MPGSGGSCSGVGYITPTRARSLDGAGPSQRGLLHSDDARFPEWGAWWWFASAKAAATDFATIYPTLGALYATAWRAAADRCQTPPIAVGEPDGTTGSPPSFTRL